MKVRANWPVDTGKKVHQAGAEFDVSKEDAEALEASGFLRPRISTAPEAEPDSEPDGGGAGDGDPKP